MLSNHRTCLLFLALVTPLSGCLLVSPLDDVQGGSAGDGSGDGDGPGVSPSPGPDGPRSGPNTNSPNGSCTDCGQAAGAEAVEDLATSLQHACECAFQPLNCWQGAEVSCLFNVIQQGAPGAQGALECMAAAAANYHLCIDYAACDANAVAACEDEIDTGRCPSPPETLKNAILDCGADMFF